MKLTPEEREMKEGRYGEGIAIAISILTNLGEIYGADKMIPISQAHIDGCIYPPLGKAALDFAEKLANSGAKVRVPTTLNIGARDIEDWQKFAFPADFAGESLKMEQAYLRMGAIPTWTCAPYLYGIVPRFGQHIAWAESNAIAFANSVIGARTARYGDFSDICAALTGRVPNFSLHLPQNRRGELLIKLMAPNQIDFNDDSIYPVIGYFVGSIAAERIPVINGIPNSVTSDHLKALGAAAASSGAVALFHILGVTPEASTYEEAFQGKEPIEIINVGEEELLKARRILSTVEEGKVDLVTIGCPHASIPEVEQLNRLLNDRKIADGTEFWVTTNRVVYYFLKQVGLLDSLNYSGVKVMRDTCILPGPAVEKWGFKIIVTNSAKCAHYAPENLSGVQVIFGNLQQCIDAALKGEIRRA